MYFSLSVLLRSGVYLSLFSLSSSLSLSLSEISASVRFLLLVLVFILELDLFTKIKETNTINMNINSWTNKWQWLSNMNITWIMMSCWRPLRVWCRVVLCPRVPLWSFIKLLLETRRYINRKFRVSQSRIPVPFLNRAPWFQLKSF